ncbi:MAG TPA: hypothetical protein VMH86_17735 [Rhizomicrobium sp.]|nr:hypothetical protein [Rhizomicrobium sp.]
MERPIHASEDVDRDENTPRIIAVVAGIVIVVVAAVGFKYSGLWSPPATSQARIATTHHAP